MSNSNTNLQTQSSNALHNAIMEAGSKDRPPMLAPGNYVQWKSRIKRYIDTKPNSELIHYCLQNPPYTYQWAEKTVPVAEGSSETTTERYMENYKNVSQDIRDQLNAEAEAVQIILTGIDNDIYSTVDACPNACEMWKAIERLKQGESINVQDLETNLYWEFGKFTSRDGESLESYYSRDMGCIKGMVKKPKRGVKDEASKEKFSDICYESSRMDQDETDDLDQERDLPLLLSIQKLKCELDDNLRYFNSLEHEVDTLKSQLETQKTQFLNEIDRLSREYYYADHMNAILGVYTDLDEFTNLQCDYVETWEKCEHLEKELSKSRTMSKRFEALQKHAINLELELQQCKETIKNDKSFKENQSNVFLKEREQYFEIQDLKAQLQEKGIAISELKKLIEKMKGKSVETKFEKSSVIRQPNAFKSQRQSILAVEIILFIVDYRCSKLMHQKSQLLTNFVEKFLKISRERFSVGTDLYYHFLQDSTTSNSIWLWLKATSYQDGYGFVESINGKKFVLVIVDDLLPILLGSILKTEPYTLVEAARTIAMRAKVHLFFWAEAICNNMFYSNRHLDGENLDKIKEKGDACIFVGYSTQSKAYRVFNKRNKEMIVETIHVNFDELPQMASDHVSSDPVNNIKCKLELLYSPLFSELLNGTSHVVSKSSAYPPPLNIQSTHQTPTQVPTVTAPENIIQAETNTENA
ncbi:hypothetical protein Tco_0597294 [Tanacetum coccineum]